VAAVIPVHAVITTHNRPEELRACVEAIAPQVHDVIVIDNASDPPARVANHVDLMIRDPEQPPNLSRLWNVGIDMSLSFAAGCLASRWDTLVLNDDFIAGPRFVERLQNALRSDHAVVASPYVYGNTDGPERVDVYEEPGTLRGLHTRMAGFAFMLRGEALLRADESLRWWYGDDDVAQQACATGGRVVVHGLSWAHLHPHQSTASRPELAEQAGRDRRTFETKWGFAPW
jgi:GT2 family glycosyltransferase